MPNVYTETEKLHFALVSKPEKFEIISAINPTQAHFFKIDPPTRECLLMEHERFCSLLVSSGVEIEFIKSIAGCPFQLFTRDVGFTIGNYLFISNMGKDLRKPEADQLKILAKKHHWQISQLKNGPIEGGDIIVDEHNVFVGISERTSRDAFLELRKKLHKDFQVFDVPITNDILHLDTVLNILPGKSVVFYQQGLVNGLPEALADYYQIEIDESEMKTLAANLLTISNNTVISQKRHKRLNKILAGRGIEVLALDLNEITKLGGGPRCSVLPIKRSNK